MAWLFRSVFGRRPPFGGRVDGAGMLTMGPPRWTLLSWTTLGALAACALPSTARATDTDIRSETAAQFYDVRSPTGEAILPRRRLTTWLSARADDLFAPKPEPDASVANRPIVRFRARLRYDADYGRSVAESTPRVAGQFVPGLERGPVDLMYGYIDAQRLVGGHLDLKLGRQYTTDALGWWSFDGALARGNTRYVALEALGGFEVREGLPFSTGRFSADGITRADRTNFPPTLYPYASSPGVAPAWGAAAELQGIDWLSLRTSYRRVMNTGRASTDLFAPYGLDSTSHDDVRVSQERLGVSSRVALGDDIGIQGAVAYDAYVATVRSAYASADWRAIERLTLGLDYDRYRPTYDADSIFNFFGGEPRNDFGVRTSIDITRHLALATGAHVRVFEADRASAARSPLAAALGYLPSNGTPFNQGANISARYRKDTWLGHASVSTNSGAGANRHGVRASLERVIEGHYLLSGTAGVWAFADHLRPTRDATSVGYVATVGYLFGPSSRIALDFQHDINRLVGHRLRTVLWLAVAVAP